nr:HEAT repeat domain-containing protein [Leptolyngbya sp. FACHB-17]
MVQTVKKEERREEEKIERFSVLEGIRKYAEQHVLLVGRPGSGKSTALARLMLEEATIASSRLPVLVELRYWQGSIEQLIRDSFTRHEMPAELFEEALGRSLLLFDGVNELPSEEARSQLSAFRRNHPKLPMIFTTRDLSLGGDLGTEKKLEMQPLTEAQMQTFIRAYVPEQAEQMLRQLKNRLREFGQTPLLLWMLCEVIQQSPDSTLPRNLGEIFRAFTEAYERSSVRKHEVAALKGDVKPLSDRRLWKKALKALAFLMMKGETPVDFRAVIDRDEAEEELNRIFPSEPFPIRDLLDDLLKYHLLRKQSSDQIEFQHQMIQEYYAAEALREQLPKLENEQLKQEYLNFLKWTEPIALMLALINNEATALRVVQLATKEVDLILGARLAGEGKLAFQNTTVDVLKQLELAQPIKLTLLHKTFSESLVPSLLKDLNDESDWKRVHAAYELGEISSDAAIDGLIQALGDKNPEVRFYSTYALIKIGSENVVNSLTQAINSKNCYVRENSAKALGEIGISKAQESLIKSLSDKEANVRSAAAYALGRIGCELAVKDLIQALTDKSSHVRSSAALALSRIGSQSANCARFALIHTLSDEESEVVYYAAQALAEIQCEEAIAALVQAFRDDNYSINQAIAEALRKIDSKASRMVLIQCLESNSASVRRATVQALGKKEIKYALNSIIQVFENDTDSYVLASAASALGEDSSDIAVNTLIRGAERESWEVRRHTAHALSSVSTDRAVAVLLQLINDENAEVRWISALSLGEIRNEVAIPALTEALMDQSADVRKCAAEALGKIGSKSGTSALLKAQADQSSEVRICVIEALKSINDTAAIPCLISLLDDEDMSVRRNAASALSHFGSDAGVETLIQDLLEISALYTSLDEQADLGALPDEYESSRIAIALGQIASPEIIKRIYECALTAEIPEAFNAIEMIQSRCKFYNYKVFQSFLKAQKADRQTPQNNESNAITVQTIERLTIMTDKAPIFNQQNATIGVNYAAEGSKQEFTQHNHASESSTEAEQQLADLLTQLRAKYPSKTDAEILNILINGFATMPQNNPQNWQRWQDIFSVIFAGGIEATKILVPVAGIPIEVLKRLYEVYDRNRTQLPGT